MSKRELIEAILEHNRTAAPDFLDRFPESDLQAYLDRVLALHDEAAKCAVRNAATPVTQPSPRVIIPDLSAPGPADATSRPARHPFDRTPAPALHA